MGKNTAELKMIFPPFEVLNNGALKKLDAQIRNFFYKKKQVIYRSGFSPGGLFIIKKGKVKIYRVTDSSKEVILHIACEGEMLGFSALIRNSDYYSWAEAIENCELLFIPKKLLNELVEGYPEFTVKLMLSFFKEFDNVIEKLVDIVSDQVRKRTAKTLFWLGQTHGFEGDNKTIGISLSRQDLAHLVATNAETLVRTLSGFRKEKIISVKGRKISIINFEKLNRIVQLP